MTGWIEVSIGEKENRVNRVLMQEKYFCSVELDSLNKEISKHAVFLKNGADLEELQAVKHLLNKWLKIACPQKKLKTDRNYDISLAQVLKLFSIIYGIPYSFPFKITSKLIETLRKINSGAFFKDKQKLKSAQKLFGLVGKYGFEKGIKEFKKLSKEISSKKLGKLRKDFYRLEDIYKIITPAVKEKLNNLREIYTFDVNQLIRKIIKNADIYDYDPNKILSAILDASIKYNINPSLIAAIIEIESEFDHKKQSPAGARGLMQITEIAAEDLKIPYENLFDIRTNIMAGARYFRKLLDKFNNNTNLALAAYNAGPTAVKKAGGIPNIPETQSFISKVMDIYQ